MSETAEACEKCGAKARMEYKALTHWECNSVLKGQTFTQSSECLERQLASLTARNAELEAACREALEHVRELREAWMSGALSERDGLGGTRSNRNVDVETALVAALTPRTP
jgi:hypothetical protein